MAEHVVEVKTESGYDDSVDELYAALNDPSKVLMTEEVAATLDHGDPDPTEDSDDEQLEEEATAEEEDSGSAAEDDKVGSEDKKTEEELSASQETDDKATGSDDEAGKSGDAELLALIKQQQADMKALKDELRAMKFAAAKAEATVKPRQATKVEETDESTDTDDELDGLFESKTAKANTEKPTKEEANTIEVLESEIQKIADTKGSVFDIQLDTMTSTEEYKDVREVCTTQNFKDITSMITDVIVEKSGGNYAERYLQVELSIWSKDNPFKYMYGLIKDHHPAYAKKEEPAKKADEKPAEGKKEVRKPEPTDAPGSIQAMGQGSADISAGWTAAKIDALPEDQLRKVPTEVYELYMQGKLK